MADRPDPPAPLNSPTPAHALAIKVLGLPWDTVAQQLGVEPARAMALVREALNMPGASDEDLTTELDRLRVDALYARTQQRIAAGDPSAIRAAAQLLGKRPRRPGKPTLDPLRSAVRRGIARGLDPKRILAEFPECKGERLSKVTRIYREERTTSATTPQAQRERRVAELEAIKRDAPDGKTVLAALRVLIKIDGSLEPAAPSIYGEVWHLIGRLTDHPLPDQVAAPRKASSQAERQLWRARLMRARLLLLRAADDVAAFRRLGPPPVGVVINAKDKTGEKVGRMSLINLYAQEHIATALHHAATNPASTPTERADSIARLVGTAAVNHQGAETSEWAKHVLGAMQEDVGGDEGGQPTSATGAGPIAEARG